jgi:hypothetical protein
MRLCRLIDNIAKKSLIRDSANRCARMPKVDLAASPPPAANDKIANDKPPDNG